MKIAVLGLGIIGSRAAANLRKNPSHRVRCWNRTPRGNEGEVSDLTEAVSEAEVITLYLKDGPAVRDVANQLFRSISRQVTLINHSTVDLASTRWLADECAKRGWNFLDAPFTGSRDAAAEAQLVYYVAGEPELVESFKPLLLETGKAIIPCGDLGRATIIKLVTNLVSACTVQALSEALATAMRHGIEAETFTAAVAGNACGSPLAALKLPTMASADFEPHFSLHNMLKDSRYVLDLAEGLDTPAIQAVSDRMAQLCDSGFADQDYSSLAAPYLHS
ncbi:NAD(P)-dependent oxidoreductase [Haloferula chungangensis]|uniref:NAD(P)-dependent oxidoreductase n=1 Tax=Haloferula chungangensis TaxID=1048331 RepID=A0ABW2L5F8_9BACT